MLLLTCIPIGILVGLARRGRLRNLEHLPIKGLPLLVLPCLLEYLGGFLNLAKMLPHWGLVSLVSCAYLMLIIGIWLNRHLFGFAVLGFGFFLNFLAVTLNGFRMPFSREAAIRAGLDIQSLPGGFQLITSNTHLPFLGDLIPIQRLGFHPPQIISIGDILIVLGVALVVQAGMCIHPAVPKETDHDI